MPATPPSSSVGTRSTDPNRRGSFSASRRPSSVSRTDDHACRARRIDPPAPRHAEVEDHRVAAVGVDQAIFGAPAKPGHPRPVSRWPRSGGNARRKSARRGSTRGDVLALEDRAPGRARWFRLREARAWPRYGMPPPIPARGRAMTDKVNFGDQLVNPEEKTRRVGGVFSSSPAATT